MWSSHIDTIINMQKLGPHRFPIVLSFCSSSFSSLAMNYDWNRSIFEGGRKRRNIWNDLSRTPCSSPRFTHLPQDIRKCDWIKLTWREKQRERTRERGKYNRGKTCVERRQTCQASNRVPSQDKWEDRLQISVGLVPVERQSNEQCEPRNVLHRHLFIQFQTQLLPKLSTTTTGVSFIRLEMARQIVKPLDKTRFRQVNNM